MEDQSQELYYQSIIKKNLSTILKVVSLIVIMTLIYELNQAYTQKMEREAQVLFEHYQSNPTEQIAEQLQDQYPKQVHTHLVNLHRAKLLFDQGHSTQALDKLYTIASSSDSMGLSDIAYFRIARIHRYLNEQEAAEKALNSIKHRDAFTKFQEALSSPESSVEREKLLDDADHEAQSPFLKNMIAVSHNDNIGQL